MFSCDKCGLCCRNIWRNATFKDLDRGDGVCKYLVDNLCSIYEERPLLCRVDSCYELYYASRMSIDEFYEKNHDICKLLKSQQYVTKKTE